MRNMLDEYGMMLVTILMSAGVIAVLAKLLGIVLSQSFWAMWG